MMTRWPSRARRPRSRSYNSDIRKNVLKYDDVMNEQREVIYQRRGSGSSRAMDLKSAAR